LATLAVDNFALPGDAGFPLNALYHAPASRPDAGESESLSWSSMPSAYRIVQVDDTLLLGACLPGLS
jgi:hypothetical protein